MFINLLLVSREGGLAGQQPIEKAVYLPTSKNSLKTTKEISFYGETENLPVFEEPRDVTFSDAESISSGDSVYSSYSRPKRKGICASRQSPTGLNKEELWLYIYAQSLDCNPYDCDCELFD